MFSPHFLLVHVCVCGLCIQTERAPSRPALYGFLPSPDTSKILFFSERLSTTSLAKGGKTTRHWTCTLQSLRVKSMRSASRISSGVGVVVKNGPKKMPLQRCIAFECKAASALSDSIFLFLFPNFLRDSTPELFSFKTPHTHTHKNVLIVASSEKRPSRSRKMNVARA